MADFIHFIVTDGTLLVALFFMITFLIALLQQHASARDLTRRMAAARPGLGNVYAALGGALTPFCSCSTVPILSGMLRAGIPFGICFTFLMASPLVNEAVVIVMWQYFGWQYVLSFVILALLLPILFGLGADRLGLGRHLRMMPQPERAVAGDVSSATGPGVLPWSARLRFAVMVGRNETLAMLPYLAVGLIIGGVIYGFVPADWIGGLSRQFSEPVLILIMALLGVPFYFNLVAIVPVAFALTEKGLGLGPMTAFLVAGAGTSLPEMSLLLRLFTIRLVAVHVAAMLLAAMLMGLFFMYFKP